MGEIARRLVHASGTGFPLLYLLDERYALGLGGWRTLQALLVAGAAVALALEALRLTGRVDWAVYDRLTRDYEDDNLAGYALYMLAMAATALLFEPTPAVPALLMLTVADPVAGLLSAGNVVKQGWVLLATFGVCVLLATPFVPPLAAVAGGAVAAVADGYKPVVRTHVVDDNITIPLGAATAMWLVLTYAPA